MKNYVVPMLIAVVAVGGYFLMQESFTDSDCCTAIRSGQPYYEYVQSLLTAKVEYEESMDRSDTIRSERLRLKYHSMVAEFKMQKDQNMCSIDRALKTTAIGDKRRLQFCYVSPLVSTLPNCWSVSYRGCLLLLRHNLSLSQQNVELVSDQSILQQDEIERRIYIRP